MTDLTPGELRKRALHLLQDSPDEWGDNSLFDLLHERHRRLLVAFAALAIDRLADEARRDYQEHLDICADSLTGGRLRQQLADAEAQRDLAKRLVSRLPMCPDHRDKFDPESCQACRAERAEARVGELEEALLFTDERPPVPCDFDLAGICKAHHGGRVYQCLVVAGERLVKRRAALARRRT